MKLIVRNIYNCYKLKFIININLCLKIFGFNPFSLCFQITTFLFNLAYVCFRFFFRKEKQLTMTWDLIPAFVQVSYLSQKVFPSYQVEWLFPKYTPILWLWYDISLFPPSCFFSVSIVYILDQGDYEARHFCFWGFEILT